MADDNDWDLEPVPERKGKKKKKKQAISWVVSATGKQGVMRYTGSERFMITVSRSVAGRAVAYFLQDLCNHKVGARGSDYRHHKSLASAKACAEELLESMHVETGDETRVDLMKAVIKLPEEQREVVTKLVDYIDEMFNNADARSAERYEEVDTRIDDVRRGLRDI